MSKLNKQLFDVLDGIGWNLDDINALIEAGANYIPSKLTKALFQLMEYYSNYCFHNYR